MLPLIALQHVCSYGKTLITLLYSTQVIHWRFCCAWITLPDTSNPSARESKVLLLLESNFTFALHMRAHKVEGQNKRCITAKQRGAVPRGRGRYQGHPKLPYQCLPPFSLQLLAVTHEPLCPERVPQQPAGNWGSTLNRRHQILKQKKRVSDLNFFWTARVRLRGNLLSSSLPLSIQWD